MKTIFILDESSNRRNQLSHNLTAMGFQVRCLTSGEFETVKEKPFAIILDEKFVSGLQALKKLTRKMSGVAVVYMKDRTDNRTISAAMKAGAYTVIEKNSAQYVNLRTTLDKLVSSPPKTSWFSRLFAKKQMQSMPALSV